MCEKCIEIAEKIDHYRRLAKQISDNGPRRPSRIEDANTPVAGRQEFSGLGL
jgi:hypothetical protein